MKVKVKEYRNGINHLYRLINVDYHACADAKELYQWERIARRILSEAEALECKRASGDDHESHRRAIEQARERLSQCQSRIADYARQGEG